MLTAFVRYCKAMLIWPAITMSRQPPPERANSPRERVESDSDFWSPPIMERATGIIVAPRAKRQIESIADIAREGIRFVNRQRGSGTRILLDALAE